MLVFEERVKPKYRDKILLEQIEEPTTNSTHMWPQPRATLVGSECSLHCIIPAPTKLKRWFVGYFRFLIQKRIIFFLYFNKNKLP